MPLWSKAWEISLSISGLTLNYRVVPTNSLAVLPRTVRYIGARREIEIRALVPFVDHLRRHLLRCQGEDEGEKQAGATSSRHQQGVRDASRRENQGGAQGVALGASEEMGGQSEDVHTGKKITEVDMTWI